MKKILFTLQLILVGTVLYAQSTVEGLVREGIQLHDEGKYQEAIKLYKQALELEPKSSLVNYELALSYMYSRDYENSLKYSDKVIKLKKENLMDAYVTKGSSLDYLGRVDESIKVFEKGIKKFGGHYLLYYNMGLALYNKGEHEDAKEALVNALDLKPGHSSSHLMLGYLLKDKSKIQSMLSFYFFLLVEPTTKRASEAAVVLNEQLKGNVEKEGENKINIFVNGNKDNIEFSAAELMISMLEVAPDDEGENLTEEEKFLKKTKSVFMILGEMKKDENKGFWWEFYVPFFYDLAQSDHIETFSHYVNQSVSESSASWVESNQDKLDAFSEWLSEE